MRLMIRAMMMRAMRMMVLMRSAWDWTRSVHAFSIDVFTGGFGFARPAAHVEDLFGEKGGRLGF